MARSVVPPGEVTRRRNSSGPTSAACAHPRRAQRRLQGQRPRRVGGEAELAAGRHHGFHHIKEIGRTGAGHGGHRVDQLLVVHPERQADRPEDGLGLGLLRRGHGRAGKEAGGAGLHQRGRVGHGAYDGQGAAEPALEAGHRNAGGNRDHQGAALPRERRQRLQHGVHDLRLDRQHQHLGTTQQLQVVAGGEVAVAGLRFELGGAGIGEGDVRRVPAPGQEAAGERRGHVAGADESDFSGHDLEALRSGSVPGGIRRGLARGEFVGRASARRRR